MSVRPRSESHIFRSIGVNSARRRQQRDGAASSNSLLPHDRRGRGAALHEFVNAERDNRIVPPPVRFVLAQSFSSLY